MWHVRRGYSCFVVDITNQSWRFPAETRGSLSALLSVMFRAAILSGSESARKMKPILSSSASGGGTIGSDRGILSSESPYIVASAYAG